MNAADLSPDLIEGFEKFIEDADELPNPRMTRDEAVAVIVCDWFGTRLYSRAAGQRRRALILPRPLTLVIADQGCMAHAAGI